MTLSVRGPFSPIVLIFPGHNPTILMIVLLPFQFSQGVFLLSFLKQLCDAVELGVTVIDAAASFSGGDINAAAAASICVFAAVTFIQYLSKN